jgi:hypothetical protein
MCISVFWPRNSEKSNGMTVAKITLHDTVKQENFTGENILRTNVQM